MKLTWIDLNSWLFQMGGKTILVDPWLVESMVFYGQPWLFTAYHHTPVAFTVETLPPIDLILISQGVDDHCHVPTLKDNRTIPVIASAAAAKRVKTLGYEQVISLAAWEEQTLDRLKITATPSAEIQPGQVENGYLLKDVTTQETLFYEPHWFPFREAERIGRVDVAIAPVIGQIFPLLGQVIMGPAETLTMIEAVRPKFFLPTTRGEIRASGLLPRLIKSVGSLTEFRDRLSTSELTTTLLVPSPGETLEVGK